MVVSLVFDVGVVSSGEESIPRRRLARQLGAGTFGQVWLCREAESNGWQVVVKSGANNLSITSPKEVRILEAASWLASESSLPRRGKICAGEPDAGRVCQLVVLEIIDGVCAGALAKASPLPEKMAGVVLTDIVGAASMLHSIGIGHGSITSSSILVSRSGHSHLCEHSVGESLHNIDRVPSSADPAQLMLPTQVRIDDLGKKKDPRRSTCDLEKDVWSFGILAIELVFGMLPYKQKGFEGEWCLSKVVEEVTSKQVSEKKSVSSLLNGFLDFVSKCLDREAARRSTAIDVLHSPFLKVLNGDRLCFEQWVGAVFDKAAL
eukprot:TRINITY_DN42812_c0_g1_i1.p1 TRINITY_DN42812_c0_g1~~TRINITY_DN42812_c0_g1_i1.p1  ORF type:complete len:320 (-),score=57.42 TRINITY_DN42812_c0_g1_i1:475-1434(-)